MTGQLSPRVIFGYPQFFGQSSQECYFCADSEDFGPEFLSGVAKNTKCQEGKPSFTKRDLAVVMAIRNGRLCSAFVLVALMIFASLLHITEPTTIEEPENEIDILNSATGRQIEADCTG